MHRCSFFGEKELIHEKCTRAATVIAETDSHLLELPAEELRAILKCAAQRPFCFVGERLLRARLPRGCEGLPVSPWERAKPGPDRIVRRRARRQLTEEPTQAAREGGRSASAPSAVRPCSLARVRCRGRPSSTGAQNGARVAVACLNGRHGD